MIRSASIAIAVPARSVGQLTANRGSHRSGRSRRRRRTLVSRHQAINERDATMNRDAAEEREAVALVERIENDLGLALERHTRMADEPPRFSRAVALHAVVDLAGRLMLSALTEEGDEARPRLAAMLRQLELLIAPESRAH